ncbi:MAG: hypothetical protein HKN60_01765 [Rhizobiales bacterium]|nr:hypothetical protein [Hyphomicrobiales bacterium]
MTTKILTGIAAIAALAIAAAFSMSANAPAKTRALDIVPHQTGSADHADANSAGRLVLTFEPANHQIDRN